MKIFLIIYSVIAVAFIIYFIIRGRKNEDLSLIGQVIAWIISAAVWPLALLIGIIAYFVGIKSTLKTVTDSIDFKKLNDVLKDVPKKDIETIIEQEIRNQLENIDNDKIK